MALQFRRYAGSQIFAFDFGGSIRCATLAMGGDWENLGDALADYDPAVQLQPLAGIDEVSERAWAQDWLAGIVGREGATIDPGARDHLWSALSSLASAPREERTLTGLWVLLQSTELKRALKPFCLDGPFGRLLDAEAEDLGSAEVLAFETEGLIGSVAAPAVLAYLFHRIEARLDGRPTMILIDEGWLALDDANFGGQLREWLKTLRKKNASVIFATQSLTDIDGSLIAPAIVESCPTRIFLPNERAFEPQIARIYRNFGLNDRQIDIVARATPKHDYYCQSRRGNRLFSLGLGEVALAFTAASSKADQTAITDLLATHGRDGFAAAWLRHRGLDWAIDLLGPDIAPADPIPPTLTRRRQNMPRNPERPTRPRKLAAALMASALVLTPVLTTPAQAFFFGGGGRIVYDPRNHAENILSSARALEQINNQIAQIQNQAQMLMNDALNLANLPHSSLAQLQDAIGETQRLLADAQSLAFDVATIEQAFAQDYGAAAAQGDFDAMIAGARERWETSVAGFEDSLRVQAGVVGNIDGARSQMDALIRESQGAVGAMQVAQAGNQLLALQSTQIADLTAAIAAQNRAEALEAARIASAEAQGRENLARFLDYGGGYSPGTVRFFGE